MNRSQSDQDVSNASHVAKRQRSNINRSNTVGPDNSFLSSLKRIPKKPEILRNYFDDLPEEVTLFIFKMLDTYTLNKCARVSKQWNRISCDESLWKYINIPNSSFSTMALDNLLRRKSLAISIALSQIYVNSTYENTCVSLFDRMPSLRLQHLDLSSQFIPVEVLNNVLKNCSDLVKLNLETCTLDEESCYYIGRNKNIITLNVACTSGYKLSGLKHIVSLKNLNELNISWSSFNNECLEYLTKNVTSRLKRLNISGYLWLPNDDLKSLVSRCTEMVELDISDSALVTSNCFKSIFQNMPNLEELSMSRCFNVNILSTLFNEDTPRMEMKRIIHGLKVLNVFSTVVNTNKFQDLCTLHYGFEVNKTIFSTIARPKMVEGKLSK